MEIKSNLVNNFTGLSLEDQRWIDECLSSNETNKEYKPESVCVNGSVSGTYNRPVNPEQERSKNKAIAELKSRSYKTPPKEIASLLEALFVNCDSKAGHWLFVAQQWNPRAINRTVSLMMKQHSRGEVTIQNPAAYFTHLIKFRKKRRNSQVSLVAVNKEGDNG